MPDDHDSLGNAAQFNPYAAPAEARDLPPLAQGDEESARIDMAIGTFVILNSVFAAMAAAVILLFGGLVLFGLFLSGDSEEEIFNGILGCVILSFPFLVAMAVYALAAIGLYKRAAWGYFFHLAGAPRPAWESSTPSLPSAGRQSPAFTSDYGISPVGAISRLRRRPLVRARNGRNREIAPTGDASAVLQNGR